MLWPAVGFPLNEYECQIQTFNPDFEENANSPADGPWTLVAGHAECLIQRNLLSWMHHHLVIGPAVVFGLGKNQHFIFFYLIYSKFNMLCIYTV